MDNFKDISLLYNLIEEKLNKALLIKDEHSEDIPIIPPIKESETDTELIDTDGGLDKDTTVPVVTPVIPPVDNYIVNPNYNIFYQTMHEDVEGEIGIYLYESANDVHDLSGEEVYNNIKVQVQVNCYKSETGLKEGLKILSSFVELVENELSDIEGIEIMSCEHIGPRACPIGKNSYNIQIVKSILDLKYYFE